MKSPPSASEQLRDEIRAVISRYGEESDVTVAETLGVLELMKAEVIERLRLSGPENNR